MTYGRLSLVNVKTEATTRERTVGVFLCVFDRTISRKSAAVGTGAIALRPLVDIMVSTEQGWAFARDQNFGFNLFPTSVIVLYIVA